MKLAEKKAQVQAKLAEREASMSRRYDGLHGGVENIGETVKQDLLANPLVKIGGVVLAGLVVGLILGKRKDKSLYKELSHTNRAVVDQYIHALRDTVLESGMDENEIREIVLDALKNRVPILVEHTPRAKSPGLFRSILRVAISSAMPLVVRTSLDYFLGQTDLSTQEGASEDP